MSAALQRDGTTPDYTTVGHVTVDVLEDGTRRVGGSAFYAALQASRLGLRARILTQGVAGEIEELIEPYRGELELSVLAAARTTTLQTSGFGSARAQRMLAWAGTMPEGLWLDGSIVHLAPVARETPASWRGNPAFLGLSPQGLLRRWSEQGELTLGPPEPRAERVGGRCEAIVLNEAERDACEGLLALARAQGAVVAVTAEERPSTILLAPAGELELAVPALEDPRDDLGAGDVFAAAFFISLWEGATPEQAGRFATAAAAVRMQGHGPSGIGSRERIEQRMSASAGAPAGPGSPPARS